MRKIEEQMINAVMDKGRISKGNTSVLYHDIGYDGGNISLSEVWLHNNLIYTLNHLTGEQTFSLCGWNTPTTRSRLNALGIGVYQKKYIAYLNAIEIKGKATYSFLNGELKEV